MADRPNIIFILTDQHRLSGVGAYGETPCRTPNIDRLAAEGVLFENAYTVYPVCSPARGTLQTGVYPHTHGITSNIHEVGCSVHELEDRPELLSRRLQAVGYGTDIRGSGISALRRHRHFRGRIGHLLLRVSGMRGRILPGTVGLVRVIRITRHGRGQRVMSRA